MAEKPKRRLTDSSVEDILGDDFVAEFGLLGNDLDDDFAPADPPEVGGRADTAEIPIAPNDNADQDADAAGSDSEEKPPAPEYEAAPLAQEETPADDAPAPLEAAATVAGSLESPLGDAAKPAAPLPRPTGPVPDAGGTLISKAPVLAGIDVPKPKGLPTSSSGSAPLPPGSGGPRPTGPIGRLSPQLGAPPPPGAVPEPGADAIDELGDAFGPTGKPPKPTMPVDLSGIKSPAVRPDGLVESGSTVINAPAYRPEDGSPEDGSPEDGSPEDGSPEVEGDGRTQVVDLAATNEPGPTQIGKAPDPSASDSHVFDPNLTEARGYNPTPTYTHTHGTPGFPRASVRRAVDDSMGWLRKQPLPAQIGIYIGMVLLAFVLLGLPWMLGGGSSYESAYLLDDFDLRSGPGTENQFTTVARLERNEELLIIKRGQNWVLVQDPFGRVGWLTPGMLSDEIPVSTSDRPFTRCRRRVGEKPDGSDCGMRAQVQFNTCSEQCNEVSKEPAECVTRCSQHQAICAKSCEVSLVQGALETGLAPPAAAIAEEQPTAEEAAPPEGEGDSVVSDEELAPEPEPEPEKKKKKKKKKKRKKRRK